jgi:hypothetical protein
LINRLLLLAAFCGFFLLASCNEVSYKEPQPAGVKPLKEFPPILVGRYVANDPGEKPDTLIIEPSGYFFSDTTETDELSRGVLGDSLVLKYFKDHYFVNARQKGQWVLRLLKPQSNGDLEFLSINIGSDEAGQKKMKALSELVKVTEVKAGSDTYHQIDPSSKKMAKLLKKGFFTVDGRLKKATK